MDQTRVKTLILHYEGFKSTPPSCHTKIEKISDKIFWQLAIILSKYCSRLTFTAPFLAKIPLLALEERTGLIDGAVRGKNPENLHDLLKC